MRQNYRKIWESHHGPIPKDQPYDIHHIDGDRTNNDIANLKLVTLQQHYDIHYAQGDFWACQAISIRLNIPVEEQAMLFKLAAQQRTGIPRPDMIGDNNPMRNPIHVLALSRATTGIPKTDSAKKQMSKAAKRRLENKHHCIYCNAVVAEPNYSRWHGENCISGPTPKKRTTPFVTNNPSNRLLTCEHCGKQVDTGNYYRWHHNNCRSINIGVC
jgi:hypothetical protein